MLQNSDIGRTRSRLVDQLVGMRYHLPRAVDRCGYDPNWDRPNALGERVLCFGRRDTEADGGYGNKGSVWCPFLS